MFKTYNDDDVPKTYRGDIQNEFMPVKQQYVSIPIQQHVPVQQQLYIPIQQQQYVPAPYVESQKQPGRFSSLIRRKGDGGDNKNCMMISICVGVSIIAIAFAIGALIWFINWNSTPAYNRNYGEGSWG